MNITDRDRRALLLLAGCAAIFLTVYFWPQRDAAADVVPAAESIPAAGRRLAGCETSPPRCPRARSSRRGEEGSWCARRTVPRRDRARGGADPATGARACPRPVAAIEIQQTDLGGVEPLGKDYGESSVTVNFNCRIVQLLNLLADSAQPELLATRDLTIRAADPKQKTMAVRLTVSGVVGRQLVPKRKELGAL
jgi:hypothetical protein